MPKSNLQEDPQHNCKHYDPQWSGCRKLASPFFCHKLSSASSLSEQGSWQTNINQVWQCVQIETLENCPGTNRRQDTRFWQLSFCELMVIHARCGYPSELAFIATCKLTIPFYAFLRVWKVLVRLIAKNGKADRALSIQSTVPESFITAQDSFAVFQRTYQRE